MINVSFQAVRSTGLMSDHLSSHANPDARGFRLAP
jgi:hypothetical protein